MFARMHACMPRGVPLVPHRICSHPMLPPCVGQHSHVCIAPAYLYQVEEGTPFARRYSPGEAPLPTDAAAAAMYCRAAKVLGAAGELCGCLESLVGGRRSVTV